MGIDIIYGRTLRITGFTCLVGTIKFCRKRNYHAIDVDILAKHLFIFIGSLRIVCTPCSRTPISHERTHIFTCTHYNNTSIGNFGSTIGSNIVFIFSHHPVVRLWFSFRFFRCLWTIGRSMERYIIFAPKSHFFFFFNGHAQCHKVIAIRFAITKPTTHSLGVRTIKQFIPTKSRASSKVTFFEH